MEKLRAEERPFYNFEHNGLPIWLIQSSCCPEGMDLKAMWDELQEAEDSTDRFYVFSSW
jgi:hypothetical protein